MTRRRRRRADPGKPVLLRPRLDPDRRRRELSPNANLEHNIEDFIGWILAAGFSPADAERRAEWIQKYHSGSGKNPPTLSLEEKAAVIAEFDRQLHELERQDLADVDPDEPEH